MTLFPRMGPEERARFDRMLADVDLRRADAEAGIPIHWCVLPVFVPDDSGEARYTLAEAKGGAP